MKELKLYAGFPRVIKYKHHGKKVSVIKELKGEHRKHCLCWMCKKFRPNHRDENCPIANKVFEFDKYFTITTPVWECTKFEMLEEY